MGSTGRRQDGVTNNVRSSGRCSRKQQPIFTITGNMKRGFCNSRSEGNASHQHEDMDSAISPCGVVDNATTNQDAGRVHKAEGLIPPSTVRTNFSFIHLNQPTSTISRYHYTIIFDGVNEEYTLSSTKYSSSAFDVASYLHEYHHVNNFDLVSNGKVLSPKSTIRHEQVVHVVGGFDLYLSSSWNKIMHSINGNMERDQERDHLPVDKKHQKGQREKRDRKKAMDKKVPGLRKEAAEKNKRGQYVYGKRTYTPKVYVEKDLSQIRKDSKGDSIDVTADINLSSTGESGNKNSPPVPTGASTGNDEAAPVLPAKEEKKKKLTTGQFSVNHEYEFEYVLSDEKPTVISHRMTKYFGLPRFAWMSYDRDHWVYYFPYVIAFILAWMVIFTSFLDAQVDRVAIKATAFNGKINFLDSYHFKNSIFYHFIIPLANLILHLLECSISVTSVFNVERLLYFWFKFLYLYSIHMGVKYFYRRFFWLIGRPVFLIASRPYYKKTVVCEHNTLQVLEDDNIDARIEIDKNFEITQSSKIIDVTDKLQKCHPVGYFDYNGKYVEYMTLHENPDKSFYQVNLEQVAQMCSPKNMAMTISAEAVLERVGNSNNVSPFVWTDRSWIFDDSLAENSARFASYVILHHRFSQRETDLYDQLFRRGDRLRLIRSPE